MYCYRVKHDNLRNSKSDSQTYHRQVLILLDNVHGRLCFQILCHNAFELKILHKTMNGRIIAGMYEESKFDSIPYAVIQHDAHFFLGRRDYTNFEWFSPLAFRA